MPTTSSLCLRTLGLTISSAALIASPRIQLRDTHPLDSTTITISARESNTTEPVTDLVLVAYSDKQLPPLAASSWPSTDWRAIDAMRKQARSSDDGLVTLDSREGPYTGWLLSSTHLPLLVHLPAQGGKRLYEMTPCTTSANLTVQCAPEDSRLIKPGRITVECRPLDDEWTSGSSLFEHPEWLCRLQFDIDAMSNIGLALPIFPRRPWIQAQTDKLGTLPQQPDPDSMEMRLDWRPLISMSLFAALNDVGVLDIHDSAIHHVNLYASDGISGTRLLIKQADLSPETDESVLVPEVPGGWIHAELIRGADSAPSSMMPLAQAHGGSARQPKSPTSTSRSLAGPRVWMRIQDSAGHGLSNSLIVGQAPTDPEDLAVFETFSDNEGKVALPQDLGNKFEVFEIRRHGHVALHINSSTLATGSTSPEDPLVLTLEKGLAVYGTCTLGKDAIRPAKVSAISLQEGKAWATSSSPLGPSFVVYIPHDRPVAIYCTREDLSTPQGLVVSNDQELEALRHQFAFTPFVPLQGKVVSSDPTQLTSGATVTCYPMAGDLAISELASSSTVAPDGTIWMVPPPRGKAVLVVSHADHQALYKYFEFPPSETGNIGTLLLRKYSECAVDVEGLLDIDPVWQLNIEGSLPYYDGPLPQNERIELPAVVPGDTYLSGRSSSGLEILASFTIPETGDCSARIGLIGSSELCLSTQGSGLVEDLTFASCQMLSGQGGRLVITTPLRPDALVCIRGLPAGEAVLEWADADGNVRAVDHISMRAGELHTASPTALVRQTVVQLVAESTGEVSFREVGVCTATTPPLWERAFQTDNKGMVTLYTPVLDYDTMLICYFEQFAFLYPLRKGHHGTTEEPLLVPVTRALVGLTVSDKRGHERPNLRVRVRERNTNYDLFAGATDALGQLEFPSHIGAELAVSIDGEGTWPASVPITVQKAHEHVNAAVLELGTLQVIVPLNHPEVSELDILNHEIGTEIGPFGPNGRTEVRGSRPHVSLSPGQVLTLHEAPEGSYTVRHSVAGGLCACGHSETAVRLLPGGVAVTTLGGE